MVELNPAGRSGSNPELPSLTIDRPDKTSVARSLLHNVDLVQQQPVALVPASVGWRVSIGAEKCVAVPLVAFSAVR